ncbi:MAG: hypothetical protein ACJASZ_002583 [Yoonia sp.]|jgi:hypothetical protein
MLAFLTRPDIHDPHAGTTNADWGNDGPGKLRVSYVLPSTDWQIIDAGTLSSASDTATDGRGVAITGPHSLVWVDISR